MKKTIVILISIVLAVVVIYASGIFQDISSFMKDGFKFEKSSQNVFYLYEDKFEVDPNSSELLENPQRQFFNLKYIRNGAITYSEYQFEDEILIQTPQNQVSINSKGELWVDGEKINQKLEIKKINDDIYVSLADLKLVDELSIIGIDSFYSDGNSMVFSNKGFTYKRATAPIETKLFESPEKLAMGNNSKDSLFAFKNKVAYSGVTGLEGFIYLADEDKPEEERSVFYISEEGVYGYARASSFPEISERLGTPVIAPKIEYKDKIVLTWEAVYSYNPDTAEIPEMPGLNIISPTWYDMESSAGNFTDMGSKEYVKWAKDRGYEVWPAFTMFKIKDTNEFFNSITAQKKAIDFLVTKTIEVGGSGINIDIEHVYFSDKDRLTHFVNMLAFSMRKWGLVVSMDVNVTQGSPEWSLCYDHRSLGSIVDYMIVMTYDQYGVSSPVAGPVAAYSWVEYHMKELIKIVEPNKLVMGLPFYTILWEEKSNPDNSSERKLSSKAIPITVQNNFIASKNFEIEWDDRANVHVATAYEDGVLYKIWIENSDSLEGKVILAKKLGLAGVAGWRRGYEPPEIWQVLKKMRE